MNQQPSTTGSAICLGIFLAALIFCIWAWAMNDDFKQRPLQHPRYAAPYGEPYPTCTDTKVVRNGSSYELEVTDCVDN